MPFFSMRPALRPGRCAAIPISRGSNRPRDIDKLAEVQFRLLERAAQLVKPGGRLVFSNCSLDPKEGEELFARFLQKVPSVENDPILPGELSGVDDWDHRAGNASHDTGGIAA